MDRRIGDMEANIAVLSRSADDLQQREVALRAAASEDTSLKK